MDGAPLPKKQWIDCPGCRESFDLVAEPQSAGTAAVDGLLRCPYCSTPFPSPAFLPPQELSVSAPKDPQAEPEFYVTDDLPLDYQSPTVRGGTDLDEEMSADKVHRLAAARRVAYRRRSWLWISAALLGVASIQLLVLISHNLRNHSGLSVRVLAYISATLFMLLLSTRLAQRARRLTQLLSQSDLDEPTTVPDFTSLSSDNADTPEWHRANQN